MACKPCEKLKICDLRHRITVQAENPTTGTGGGRGNPWASPTTVATVSACIEPLRGMERVRAMQIQDTTTHKITLRYRSGILPRHRIKFGTRLFNIHSVINVEERNRWIEIMAEEGGPT